MLSYERTQFPRFVIIFPLLMRISISMMQYGHAADSMQVSSCDNVMNLMALGTIAQSLFLLFGCHISWYLAQDREEMHLFRSPTGSSTPRRFL